MLADMWCSRALRKGRMIVLSCSAIEAGSSQFCAWVSGGPAKTERPRPAVTRAEPHPGLRTHLFLGAGEPPQHRERGGLGEHFVPRLGHGLLGRQVLTAQRGLDVAQDRSGLGQDVRLVAEA